ncbi:MAG: NUDIX domain-containing protein [Planctomycetota bacterium]
MSGVRVETIDCPIRIRVSREPLTLSDDEQQTIDRAWDRLCQANPRYFNGRILSFESFDRGSGIASARDVEYRLHAVRETMNSGVRFFGVTGLLAAVEDDQTRYLLGRRGASVHEYPGLWEFAPCGGIDPPPDRDLLTTGAIIGELCREASEELGIDLSQASPKPLALVHDEPVGSTDLVLRIELGARPAITTGWEYPETRWLTLDEVRALHHATGGGVIPTTLAMADRLQDP